MDLAGRVSVDQDFPASLAAALRGFPPKPVLAVQEERLPRPCPPKPVLAVQEERRPRQCREERRRHRVVVRRPRRENPHPCREERRRHQVVVRRPRRENLPHQRTRESKNSSPV